MMDTLPFVTLDIEGLYRNLRREGTPDRVYYFEHGVAPELASALQARFGIWDGIDADHADAPYQRMIATHCFLGQELFRIYPATEIRPAPAESAWENEGVGVMRDWRDFERFPWPAPPDALVTELDAWARLVPGDMRVFFSLKLWETVRELFGFTHFCMTLFDDPPLIEAVVTRVAEYNLAVLETCCRYPCVGAVYLIDDLGYKTSTMLAPEVIRELFLPWHRRMAELAHTHDKLVLFHSCGQMYTLMDAYIDEVGIDAKHSFEEVVLPVTEAKRRYGRRVALLGGMDVDFLARADEAAIRRKTREYLEVCQPGGGYCLGSGNWVTHYIPLDNYLAMLDEARRWA